MQNILLIALLFLLTFGPSRVCGTERYAAQDTSLINLLIYEADSLRYQAIDIVKAHITFLEALELSKELNQHRGAEIRRKLAYNMAGRDKLDSALLAYNDLFDFCLRQKDYSGLAEAYYSVGGAFAHLGKYSEAESFYLESIKHAEQHNLQALHCKFLRMLSTFYDNIGQQSKALESAQKALLASKNYQSEYDVALSSMQLGNLFLSTNDYNTAGSYYKVHQHFFEKVNHTLHMARAQVNWGNYYFQYNKEDSAVYHYKRAIGFFNASGNRSKSVGAVYNTASAYYSLDSFPQFLKYLDEAESIYTSMNDYGGILNVMYSRTEYHKKIGEYKAAISISKNAIQTCLESENLQSRMEFYEKLADTYQLTEQFDSALFYNRAYLVLYDSIYTDELREGLITADMENRYNATEREKQIEVLKLLNERRLYIMWGLGLLALLILLLAIIGMRSIQHKRNLAETRLKLHEQKIEKLLSDQELKSINAMMEGQDIERKRIAQDLHDRLGSMLSTVKHHFSAMESKITELRDQNMEQYKTAINLLDDAVREVRHISHDMLSGTLVKFGLAAALEDLKNSIEVPGKLTVELNLFGLDQRLENEVEIALYRIIQELVGNSLKHAKASEMSIQLTLSDDNLNVMVEDNGRGFDAHNITSDGIGLQNIYERIERQNGTYHLDASIGRGTTFVFDIPVSKTT